jgi:hypothetical protein
MQIRRKRPGGVDRCQSGCAARTDSSAIEIGFNGGLATSFQQSFTRSIANTAAVMAAHLRLASRRT